MRPTRKPINWEQTVNAEIAEAVHAASRIYKSEPKAAREALIAVRVIDPDNAYVDYLVAATCAVEGDSEGIWRFVLEGNCKPHFRRYSAVPIYEEERPEPFAMIKAVTRATAELSNFNPPNAKVFIEAVRKCGLRTMASEPMLEISYLVGVAMVKMADTSAYKYFSERDEKEAQRILARQAKFVQWFERYSGKFVWEMRFASVRGLWTMWRGGIPWSEAWRFQQLSREILRNARRFPARNLKYAEIYEILSSESRAKLAELKKGSYAKEPIKVTKYLQTLPLEDRRVVADLDPNL